MNKGGRHEGARRRVRKRTTGGKVITVGGEGVKKIHMISDVSSRKRTGQTRASSRAKTKRARGQRKERAERARSR